MRRGIKVRIKDYMVCVLFFCLLSLLFCAISAVFVLCWNSVLFWIAVVVMAICTVIAKNGIRQIHYRKKLRDGVDYGIKQECLYSVPRIMERCSRRSPWRKCAQVNVAPIFDNFAATYSQVRVGAVLYSRKLLSSDLEICDEAQYIYRFICRDDDETYYCVRQSSGDERIFKLELELGKSTMYLDLEYGCCCCC